VASAFVPYFVTQSDKTASFIPPYASEDERARIDDERDQLERRLWIADEAGSRRYYLAGGGRAEDFAQRWELLMRVQARMCDALERGVYTAAGGALF